MDANERGRLVGLRTNLERRALVFESVRSFFRERGYIEVETPVRVPTVAPELYIVPFESDGWYLSTSPELHMKRLLAAGYERLFQISRCFRRGERGRRHNPEFAMLECYRVGADYLDMAREIAELVSRVAQRLGFHNRLQYQGSIVDITTPWPEITVREVFLDKAGWDPVATDDPVRFDVDLVDRVLPVLPQNRPLILRDYPASMAALARLKPGDPGVAERLEIFVAGLELVNIYSELNDPGEQARRFAAESRQIAAERGHSLPVAEKFLAAVTSLPECGGVALGLDRLVMLLCNAASIDEVTAFTVDTA